MKKYLRLILIASAVLLGLLLAGFGAAPVAGLFRFPQRIEREASAAPACRADQTGPCVVWPTARPGFAGCENRDATAVDAGRMQVRPQWTPC